MRIGSVAAHLAEAGHQVVWWASTFSHFLKEKLANEDTVFQIAENYDLRLLEAGAYPKNISLARFSHHLKLAWRMSRIFPQMEKPDVIVSCWPIPEVCLAAHFYATKHGIPFLIDVRDCWPDTFLELLPRLTRPLGKLALAPMFLEARYLFPRATGVIGISPGFLQFGLDYASRAKGENDCLIPLGYSPKPTPKNPPAEQLRPLLASLREKVVFTYSGSFSTVYDLETVCRAAERLVHREDILFLMVGEGTTSERVLAAAEPLPNVITTGWVDQESLQHLLSVSDVGLLPWCSVPNSMPNKAFEYLSMGLPVLNSSPGDMTDFLASHQAGLSYRSNDVVRFQRLVEQLADSKKQREQMSLRAHRAFQESFSPEQLAERFEQHLQKVVKRTTRESLSP